MPVLSCHPREHLGDDIDGRPVGLALAQGQQQAPRLPRRLVGRVGQGVRQLVRPGGVDLDHRRSALAASEMP